MQDEDHLYEKKQKTGGNAVLTKKSKIDLTLLIFTLFLQWDIIYINYIYIIWVKLSFP